MLYYRNGGVFRPLSGSLRILIPCRFVCVKFYVVVLLIVICIQRERAAVRRALLSTFIIYVVVMVAGFVSNPLLYISHGRTEIISKMQKNFQIIFSASFCLCTTYRIVAHYSCVFRQRICAHRQLPSGSAPLSRNGEAIVVCAQPRFLRADNFCRTKFALQGDDAHRTQSRDRLLRRKVCNVAYA